MSKHEPTHPSTAQSAKPQTCLELSSVESAVRHFRERRYPTNPRDARSLPQSQKENLPSR